MWLSCPTLFAAVAPPGSANVPFVIGSLCLGIMIIGAIAARTAPVTYRIQLNELGTPDAKPVSREEYDGPRREARRQSLEHHLEGLTTIADPPPRRTGSAAAIILPSGLNSIAVAAPISAAEVKASPAGASL